MYFGNTNCKCGGYLELDMNAGGKNDATNPIEHIYYKDKCSPGKYKIKVRFYSKKSNYSSDNFTLIVYNKCNKVLWQKEGYVSESNTVCYSEF